MKKSPIVADLLLKKPSFHLTVLAGEKGLRRPVRHLRAVRCGQAAQTRELPSGAIVLCDPTMLKRLGSEERRRLLERWAQARVAAIVSPTSSSVPSVLLRFCRQRQIPLLGSDKKAPETARRLDRRLLDLFTSQDVVHGVLMDIAGVGTLIVGESGIGKSESALDLIERGHRLVADDVVEILSSPGGLVGRSPRLTRYFMELRGLGIINVRDLFGARSIRRQKTLDLVIQLERWETATTVERVGLDQDLYRILGCDLPLVRMPVGPSRNLALLIEVAARNHRLKSQGRHGARRLVNRVSRMLRQASPKAGPRQVRKKR